MCSGESLEIADMEPSCSCSHMTFLAEDIVSLESEKERQKVIERAKSKQTAPAHELLRKSYDRLTCLSSFVLFAGQDETPMSH